MFTMNTMAAFERQLEPGLVLQAFDMSESRRFVYLEVIKAIVQEIAHFESLTPLLNHVVSALQQRLCFYIASIFQYDSTNGIAILVAQEGQSACPAPIGYVQPDQVGLLGKALREGTTLLVDDVTAMNDYVSPQGYAPARSELCVPIFADGALWGAFNVESVEAHAFSYYDRLALELVASQLGSAIYNLQLRNRQESILQELSDYAAEQQQLLDQVMQLSTPVFPVYPGILALPLIGTLDHERMQRTTAVLLDMVQKHRSRSVIVDITGVALLNKPSAQKLLSLIHASKLLGAEVVITGMRPDVARTLVDLQVEIGQVVVRGTFAAGLQYALHQNGQRITSLSLHTAAA